nr:hypothetical protein [Kibdelosporangium sp. MJ126-NF4]CEL19773.1 D-Glucosaminate-6-phosphate ammonia-lyase [Kibdelosporangium sp. MJ126-NF4]CTQ96998.1 D-Glucosaminate-6-phosphate ammonia-lyase (EC 4.3.1.-) [Kibdelosporangium sp. MJ126-NF4]
MRADALNRRGLLRRGGALGGLLALGPLLTETAASAVETQVGKDVYRSIGVRPMINARGTFTILSGSRMLPEVRAAIDAAARQFVHLDELADAVGVELAKLTGAEFGLVSSGCAAGLTHATAACVAGGNPDLHVRIPDLTGFEKTEVIIPRHSRNVYEAAVSAVGVRVVEVSTRAELERALGPQTALVYVMAGPQEEKSELPIRTIAAIANPRDVPILVDAAAEVLTIPNVHLRNGATLVGYSGGKCLRGPQSAGLLLGRKDLVRAAWVHSAPHHGFARGFKVGKEEAIGMLMAVQMWTRRDHDAEWRQWTSWLNHIADRVSRIRGVQTTIVQPEGLSNRTPSLRILWDEKQLRVSGKTIADVLYQGEPRIALNQAGSSNPPLTGLSITPYMMAGGEERIIANRIHDLLRNPPPQNNPPTLPPAADLTGDWAVQIDFAAGRSTKHVLRLSQNGNKITGTHTGEFVTRDLTGTISATDVSIRSTYGEQNGDALSFTFTGKVDGARISGTLDMGEYLAAQWTARKQ